MGMSASQARFLMLTARRSDIEYQVQQINQERMNITNNMDGVTQTYTDKLNNTMLVYKNADNEECTITYDAITTPIAEGGMGMFIVNDAGKILVASEEELEGKTDEELKNYWVDSNLKDTEFLEKNLRDGVLYIGQYGENDKITKFSIDGMSDVLEVSDTSDDAEAETEYNLQMTKLQRNDKMLELELTQLETEHQAIQTEIDSIQDVINKDIESGFKTFGS